MMTYHAYLYSLKHTIKEVIIEIRMATCFSKRDRDCKIKDNVIIYIKLGSINYNLYINNSYQSYPYPKSFDGVPILCVLKSSY